MCSSNINLKIFFATWSGWGFSLIPTRVLAFPGPCLSALISQIKLPLKIDPFVENGGKEKEMHRVGSCPAVLQLILLPSGAFLVSTSSHGALSVPLSLFLIWLSASHAGLWLFSSLQISWLIFLWFLSFSPTKTFLVLLFVCLLTYDVSHGSILIKFCVNFYCV